MEEMRAMIGRRHGGLATPQATRPRSIVEGSLSSLQLSTGNSMDDIEVQNWAKSLDEVVSDAENNLGRAMSGYTKVEKGIDRLVVTFQEVSSVRRKLTLISLHLFEAHQGPR